MANQALLLKPKDVAERIGVGISKAGAMIRSGELPSITIGRLRRVPAHLLEEWIAEQIEKQEKVVK